jgi:acyl carrier protein
VAQSTFEQVKEIIIEHLQVAPDQVTMEANVKDDLEADSLDVVELIMRFEDTFDLTIPDEDAEKITTIGDIVNYIEQKKA